MRHEYVRCMGSFFGRIFTAFMCIVYIRLLSVGAAKNVFLIQDLQYTLSQLFDKVVLTNLLTSWKLERREVTLAPNEASGQPTKTIFRHSYAVHGSSFSLPILGSPYR